jgi:hypothetical protein
MSAYRERLAADRRLVILRVLAEAPGYSVNSSILGEILSDWGHAVARDVLHADLAWLAEQGLVDADQVASVWTAQLTQRGADVAAGRAHVPGVRRPGPGG